MTHSRRGAERLLEDKPCAAYRLSQLQHDLAAHLRYRLHANVPGQRSKLHHVQQVPYCSRQRPEPVSYLLADGAKLVTAQRPRQALVYAKSSCEVRHVVKRNVCGYGQVQLHVSRQRRGVFSVLLRPELRHGLRQQLRVEVVADSMDVAALLSAQDVARTPDLQVSHGDAEPRAQLRGCKNGLQPLLGRLRDAVVPAAP